MNKHELLVAISQCLADIKENLKLKVDCTLLMIDGSHILFSCKKENGRIQVFKIEVKAL